MKNLSRWMALGILGVAYSSGALDIYVSPMGDDQSAGSEATPLRTLKAARNRVRGASAIERVSGITIYLQPGTYALDEALLLGGADSGGAGNPIVWRAVKRGTAVISGAQQRTWSVPAADDPNMALIPEKVRARVRVTTLPGKGILPDFLGDYVSPNSYHMAPFRAGRELTNARWPDCEEADAPGPTKAAEKDAKEFAIRVAVDKARLEAWRKEPDLWVWGAWEYLYADANAPILKVDVAAGTITVPTKYVKRAIAGCDEGGQWHVRNAFAEMDQDDEWVADRKNRRIYLLPGEAGVEGVTISQVMHLVDAASLHDAIFEGIVFEGSRGDAVNMMACTNVTMRACIVRATGGWAAKVKKGQGCRFDGCDLYNLGEGGVSIEAGEWKTLTPGGHVVDNCHIHHFGQRVYNYRPAIFLMGVGNRATHNLIHHSRHAGIIFTDIDQYLGYNIVHDTCLNNFDCGAFYTHTKSDWWARGSVLEYNMAHMTGRHRGNICATAFYIDGWASGVTLRGNIASRASEGFFQNGGNGNIYERNIAICCSRSFRRGNLGLQAGRIPYPTAGGLGVKSDLYRRLVEFRPLFEKAPWKDRYPHMLDVLKVKDPIRAHNSFWCVLTNNVASMGGPISLADEDQMDGTETAFGNVQMEDEPGFRNYKGFDWELKADAAARKVTGTDTRWAQMGLYESPWRISPAVKLGEGVTPPFDGPDRPMPIAIVRMFMPGPLPAGQTEYATNLVNCECSRWNWEKGNVLSAQSPTLTARGGWMKIAYSFTPTVSGLVTISVQGWRGEKTLYDDFEVEGATLENGDFETEVNWSKPKPPKNPRKMEFVDPPYGIVGRLPGGYAPRRGKGMLAANVYLSSSGKMRVTAGVPVKMSFWCRGYVPQ